MQCNVKLSYTACSIFSQHLAHFEQFAGFGDLLAPFIQRANNFAHAAKYK